MCCKLNLFASSLQLLILRIVSQGILGKTTLDELVIQQFVYVGKYEHFKLIPCPSLLWYSQESLSKCSIRGLENLKKTNSSLTRSTILGVRFVAFTGEMFLPSIWIMLSTFLEFVHLSEHSLTPCVLDCVSWCFLSFCLDLFSVQTIAPECVLFYTVFHLVKFEILKLLRF